jgi:hypothetical protein
VWAGAWDCSLQRSAFSYQLSAISFQLSAVSYQLSASLSPSLHVLKAES